MIRIKLLLLLLLSFITSIRLLCWSRLPNTTPNSKSLERAWSRGIVDRTKEYSFVLSTMPRLLARSGLLELGVFSISVGSESLPPQVNAGPENTQCTHSTEPAVRPRVSVATLNHASLSPLHRVWGRLRPTLCTSSRRNMVSSSPL